MLDNHIFLDHDICQQFCTHGKYSLPSAQTPRVIKLSTPPDLNNPNAHAHISRPTHSWRTSMNDIVTGRLPRYYSLVGGRHGLVPLQRAAACPTGPRALPPPAHPGAGRSHQPYRQRRAGDRIEEFKIHGGGTAAAVHLVKPKLGRHIFSALLEKQNA